MTKLDKKNRLYIPAAILKIAKTNLNSNMPIGIFARGPHTVYLANPPFQSKNFSKYLGMATVDDKNRMYLSSSVRKFLDIDTNSKILVYISLDKITIEKYIALKKFN